MDFDFIDATSEIIGIEVKPQSKPGVYSNKPCYGMYINKQPVLVNICTLNNESVNNTLFKIAEFLKDEDNRYMLSSISEITNGVVLDTIGDVIRLISNDKYDPDLVITACNILMGMEDVSCYTAMSKQIAIYSPSSGQNSFKLSKMHSEIKLDRYSSECRTFYHSEKGPAPRVYMAQMLNRVTGYLDVLGMYDDVMDKLKIRKLEHM